MHSNSLLTLLLLSPSIFTVLSEPAGSYNTFPCVLDYDCASKCCSTIAKTCQTVLELEAGVESCGDGRTPNYDGVDYTIVVMVVPTEREAAEAGARDEREAAAPAEAKANKTKLEIGTEDDKDQTSDSRTYAVSFLTVILTFLFMVLLQ